MQRSILLFIIPCVVASCSMRSIEQDVVLKIGEIEVSGYEIKRQLEGALDDIGSEDEYNKIQNLVNKYRIVAEAYSLGYDTLSEITRNVHHVSNLMMIQSYGYYWDAVYKPAIEEFSTITAEKQIKRSKCYSYNIIKITDKNQFVKQVEGDTLLFDSLEFKGLAEKCDEYSFLDFEHKLLRWPFVSYFEIADTLYSIQKGEVSRLLKSGDTYFYFYLRNIRPAKVDAEDKQLMCSDLGLVKKKMLESSKDREILFKSGLNIYDQAVENIAAYIESGFDLYSYPGNDTVLSFDLNDTTRYVTFIEFIEPLTFFPVQVSIPDRDKLLSELTQYCYDRYLIQESRELGLYNNEQFLLDKKVYTNNVIFSKYVEDEIRKGIHVDSVEIADYYQANQDALIVPGSKLTHCYYFNSKEDALKNWKALTAYYENKPHTDIIQSSELINLHEVMANYKVNLKDTTQFPEEDVLRLINLAPGSVSFPIIFNKGFAIFVCIKDEDTYVPELDVVSELIAFHIAQQKMEKALELELRLLKEKHLVMINKIDEAVF